MKAVHFDHCCFIVVSACLSYDRFCMSDIIVLFDWSGSLWSGSLLCITYTYINGSLSVSPPLVDTLQSPPPLAQWKLLPRTEHWM